MKRKSKLTIEPKYILIICSCLCAILIFVSFRYSEKLEPVKNAFGAIVTPMQKGINTVGSFLSDKSKIFTNMQKLLKENQKLKKENDTLSYENRMLQQDKYDYEKLKELYSLDKKYDKYPKLAARVITKDPTPWNSVFTINKGTKDGIKVGQNVLADGGLVGIITQAGYNYAVVRSVIDDKSNVTGTILKTKESCNVKGDLQLIDKGLIKLEFINKDAEVENNYEVVTSRNSDKFLDGILIGYVKDVTLDSNNMTKSGYLTPVVDFKHLDTVLVITTLKEPLYAKAPEKKAEEKK